MSHDSDVVYDDGLRHYGEYLSLEGLRDYPIRRGAFVAGYSKGILVGMQFSKFLEKNKGVKHGKRKRSRV